MRIAFLSFASTNLSRPLERIKKEAIAMNCFDEIWCMNENDLDEEYLKKHLHWMKNLHPRGFGAWMWKAQCVHQALRQLNHGDALVYADAGCVLNPEGVPRLKEYIQMALDSPYKNVSFQMGHLEKMWTKGDIFHVLQYDDKESGQLVGGIFVLIKTPEIVELVNVWNFLSQQYQLIGDYPSHHPNDPSFQEHRHDQSIFGILRKKFGTVSLGDETWWPEEWNTRKEYPIHARRMK